MLDPWAGVGTASKMDLVRRAVNLQRWRVGGRLMRKSLSVALALAWVAFADPGLAADTGLAARTGLAADVPFKVLSAGKVAGQVEAGLTEVRDAKTLAQVWSRLGLKGRVPKVNFKQRMVVAWVGGGSACDKYVLTRVHADEGNVVLEINRVRPPPGHMCIMIFSPSTIVASLPQTSKPAQASVSDGGSTAGEATR
jgi:hypothetical protein